jgi:hypothetical protein
MKPSFDDWVWVQAMLVQAMIGVVSTNVRQICLLFENGWKISATLEHPNEQDVDDIQDIADEMSIFMEDIKDRISPCAYTAVSTSISSSSDQLENSNSPDCRIVFRRKEVAE